MSATPQSTAGPATEQPAPGTGYKCGLCRDTGFRPAQPRGTAGLAQATAGVVACECRGLHPDSAPAESPRTEHSGVEGRASPHFESPDSIAKLLRTGRGRTGIAFDKNERAVLRCLTLRQAQGHPEGSRGMKDALGHENAVSLKEIGRQTGLDARAIKGVVESLRTAHGLKVGSSRVAVTSHQSPGTSHQYGYYWITNAEELLDTGRPFVRQAVTMLRTWDALTDGRHGLARLITERAGQLKLFEAKP